MQDWSLGHRHVWLELSWMKPLEGSIAYGPTHHIRRHALVLLCVPKLLFCWGKDAVLEKWSCPAVCGRTYLPYCDISCVFPHLMFPALKGWQGLSFFRLPNMPRSMLRSDFYPSQETWKMREIIVSANVLSNTQSTAANAVSWAKWLISCTCQLEWNTALRP